MRRATAAPTHDKAAVQLFSAARPLHGNAAPERVGKSEFGGGHAQGSRTFQLS